MKNNKIRLQKFLSQAGVCSRRQAELYIKDLRVEICPARHRKHELAQALGAGDGVKCTKAKIGDKIDPDKDQIFVDGKQIKSIENYIYYALNKPVGYTSSVRDINAKKLVTDLVPKEPKVWPVGRLDRDSKGLIILTNDGELTNKLTHPRYRHRKVYDVKLKTKNEKLKTKAENLKLRIEKLNNRIKLTEGWARFDKFEIINFDEKLNIAIIKVELHQGWKRQIRRMCEKVGLRVLELQRTRLAKLELGDLKEGKYKIINKSDII